MLSLQEELSVLLTDVHQYKRNLDEHFSKLINNKSRIAVSAMCQGSLCSRVLCVPHSPWSNLCSWVSPAHVLSFSSPFPGIADRAYLPPCSPRFVFSMKLRD